MSYAALDYAAADHEHEVHEGVERPALHLLHEPLHGRGLPRTAWCSLVEYSMRIYIYIYIERERERHICMTYIASYSISYYVYGMLQSALLPGLHEIIAVQLNAGYGIMSLHWTSHVCLDPDMLMTRPKLHSLGPCFQIEAITYIYIYTYIYTCIAVCICLCIVMVACICIMDIGRTSMHGALVPLALTWGPSLTSDKLTSYDYSRGGPSQNRGKSPPSFDPGFWISELCESFFLHGSGVRSRCINDTHLNRVRTV